MLQDFDVWSVGRLEVSTFDELNSAVLAIEASFYLERLLTTAPAKEPLLSALGGLPFALKAHIENEIELLRKNGIRPLFVFDGLEVGKKYTPFRASDEAAGLNREAWDLYNLHQAEKAVDTFGSSGYAKPQNYYSLLQSILHTAKVDFQVAPYGALGQLAYLLKPNVGDAYVDAIAGSSELLLLDVDKVITSLDFEHSEFTSITRQACLEELGLTSTDTLVDAFMLSGSSLLPPLPTLNITPTRRKPRIRAAIDLIKSNGENGHSVCMRLQNEPALQEADYLDRYRRSRLAIKHQVVLTSAGRVEPLAHTNIPSDLHEIIGQRLPEELYYYLSIAAIGPRILNQVTSQRIFEMAPADGGEAEEYRALVREKLTPLRATALSLLSRSLPRVYTHRVVKMSFWFEPNSDIVITLSEVQSPTPILEKWNVAEEVLADGSGYKADNITLSFALKSLIEPSFAARTITPKDTFKADKPTASKLLTSKAEITSNTIFRFLHLSNYINDDHELSAWGKVLAAMLSDNSPTTTSDDDEAAILATALLRLDLLNANNMFPTYSGAPIRGSENDKRNTLLVSRIACLGRLHHKSIGFTGPLSRHLLGYSSMINAVRSSLRDLLEMSLATLLMNGDAARTLSSTELTDIGLSLPLLLPSDCSLGIAMKQYLDELSNLEEISEDAKAEIRTKGTKEWFPYSEDFTGDLERAFELWDRVYKGVKVAVDADLVKDRDVWDEVDVWLKARR